jgi:hypothetical protein
MVIHRIRLQPNRWKLAMRSGYTSFQELALSDSPNPTIFSTYIKGMRFTVLLKHRTDMDVKTKSR